jgi:hypothetical protein
MKFLQIENDLTKSWMKSCTLMAYRYVKQMQQEHY